MNEYESPTVYQLGGEDNVNDIQSILIVVVILAIVLFLLVIEVADPPPLY